MTIERVVIVVNPRSGSGHSRALVRTFADRAAAQGYATEIVITRGPAHVSECVAQRAAGDTCIAVAGGDGTVRDALVGLSGRPSPLLLVPLGTENLLARQLRIETTFESIWHAFTRGVASPFDLALLNGRPFATVVGAGFDAEVVARVTAARRGHITHLDYFWPLWRTFWRYRFPTIRVVADGREVCNQPALVFIGNIPRYAAGMRILRDARWDDGRLDLCVLRCDHHGALVEHVIRVFLNWHVESRQASYHQVTRVELESPDDVGLQCDGDQAGRLPAVAQVVPSAIRVLIPPPPARARQFA